MSKNYGSFRKDDNNVTIQTGTSFKTADSTGTPITSPTTVGAAQVAIAVPVNAAEVVFNVNAAMLVSEVDGMAQYYTQSANTVEVYACSNIDTIYVKRSAGDVTLNFRFILV